MAGIPQYLQDKADQGEIKGWKGGVGGPLETGHYRLKVVGFEEDKKNSGDGVNIEFEITHGLRTGYVSKFNWFAYSDKAAGKLIALYDALGYTYDSEYQELVDDEAECIAYVTKEPQQKDPSKFQNNIAEFIAIDEDSVQLLED
jgi:hypothetical protein